jgi:anti-anti-sigma factor
MESLRVANSAMAACRLSRGAATLGPARNVYRNEAAMTGILKLCPKKAHTVHVTAPLEMPLSRSLRHDVHALLRRGERRIELDLAAVSKIDAAGIGELIRAFNMTAAVNGALRIVNATAWVREMLERAHLFEPLTAKDIEQRLA